MLYLGCIIVFITCPIGEGERIARGLLKEKLAACVNIVRGVRSIYWWEEKIEESEEELLICKSNEKLLSKLINTVKRVHSYEVPEILALRVYGGNSEYLNWVLNTVLGGGEHEAKWRGDREV